MSPPAGAPSGNAESSRQPAETSSGNPSTSQPSPCQISPAPVSAAPVSVDFSGLTSQVWQHAMAAVFAPLGLLLALALLTGLVWWAAVQGSSESTPLGTAIFLCVQMLVLALGGLFQGTVFDGGLIIAITGWMLPVTLTVVMMALIGGGHYLARKRQKKHTPLVADGLLCLVCAAAAAFVMTVIGLSTRVTLKGVGANVGSVGVTWWWTFLAGTCLIFLSGFVGRLIASKKHMSQSDLTSHPVLSLLTRLWRNVEETMRMVGDAVLVATVLVSVVALVTVVVTKITEPGDLIALLIVGGFNLVHVVVYGMGFAMGMPISAQSFVLSATADTSSEPSIGLLAHVPHPLLYLSVLGAFAVALMVGVRSGLRRGATGWCRDWWQYLIVMVGGWLIVALLAMVRVSASGNARFVTGGYDYTLHLGFFSVLLLAGVWAMITVLIASFGTAPLASVFPRLAVVVAGKRLHPHWRSVVMGASENHHLSAPLPQPGDSAQLSPPHNPATSPHNEATGASSSPPTGQAISLQGRQPVGWVMFAVLVVGSALLVVGTVSVTVLLQTRYTAEVAAQRTMQALNSGDVDTLSALVHDWDTHGSELLTSSALVATHSGADAITNVEVKTSSLNDGTSPSAGGEESKILNLTYTIDGQDFSTTLIAFSSGKRWGVFPQWQLYGLTGSLEHHSLSWFDNQSQPFRVEGVDHEFMSSSVAAAPGRYRVAAVGNDLMTGLKETVTVLPGQATALRLKTGISQRGSEIVTEVSGQLTNHCAITGEQNLAGCVQGQIIAPRAP